MPFARSVPPRECLAVLLPRRFRPAIYGGLGGASLGIWPGLLADFMRLRREEWAPTRSD